MEGDWAKLPMELLALIYEMLSRRDRLSCSLVCRNWQEGLDHMKLWKTFVVHIDTDLTEPSTIFLVRDFCKHIRCLEFGWSVPHRHYRWSPVKFKDITKRTVRFLQILHDNYIQISTLRIFNWFDFVSFQKVNYHLARFLKNQENLENIIFDNLSIHSLNYVKLLTACLSSKTSITTLDIGSCYYYHSAFDMVYFRSCIEQFSNLKILKLDYLILSSKLIESILISKNKCLENLEIILKETSCHDKVIGEEEWCLLNGACPNLKVTLTIRNVYHYAELRRYLQETIPLVSISITLPKTLGQGGPCDFKKTLNLLVGNYNKTLEFVDLNVKNEDEILDDTILMMLRRLSQLKSFFFNGIFNEPVRLISTFKDVTCFNLTPHDFPDKYFISNNLIENLQTIEHKRVQFRFMRQDEGTMCTLLILN